MSKPPKLPNHSIEALRIGTPVSSNKCEDLKIKYGFDSEFNLWARIQDDFMWYEAYKHKQNKESITEQRKLFNVLTKRSKLLKECLDKLGLTELSLLRKQLGNGDPYLQDLGKVLDELAINSEIIENELSDQTSDGRNKDIPQDNFIRLLAKTFEDGTGKRATSWYHAWKGGYGGEFADFVYEIFEEVNLNRSKSTIATRAKKILKSLRGETPV